MIQLRDYQIEAINSIYAYWNDKKGVNPIVSACVGAGKSLLISKLIKDVLDYDKNSKVLILTHLAELLEQNSEELKRLDSSIDVSLYSAGLGIKCLEHNVIYAGIQSIFRQKEKLPKIDLLLIDEAHLVPKNSDTMYGKTINFLRELNPLLKVVGFSGTPYRLDGGYLHQGKDALFDGIAHDISIKDLVKKGYLCKPIGKNSINKLKLDGVSIKNGEFDLIELAEVTNNIETVEKSVKEFVEYGKDRKAWLVFCSGISHAELVQEELLKYDIKAEIVTGGTDKKDRARITQNFKEGKIKCLLNINTLTAGYNAPICDMVVMLRATMSASLFVQCIGRGLRLYDGKENCLILDYGSNFERFGHIDNIQPIIKGKGKKKKEPPKAKECPECQTILSVFDKVCYECGFNYPMREPTHSTKAYSGELFSEDIKPTLYNVDSVFYYKHLSKKGKECLKIVYGCGVNFLVEYIIPNSYYGKQSLQKIGCHYLDIDEIINNKDSFIKPIQILAKKEGKYMKIEDKIYEGVKSEFAKCCKNCLNLEHKEEKQGYKTIKKYYCSAYNTEIGDEWLEVVQVPECEKIEYIPF